VQAERQAAERVLQARRVSAPGLTVDEVAALIDRVGNVASALGAANVPTKAQLYASLGLTLTFESSRDRVLVEARPWTYGRVRGGSASVDPWPEIRGVLDLSA
jgi:hypothetical protein